MENNKVINFELLHRHIIGDIEKDIDENIKEYGKYFFQNEAYRLFKKVETIHVKTENDKNPVSNSVLAVTGERGSGKTSFLKTIEKEFKQHEDYYTFPVIDPASLHGDLNILEIVCTHIDIIVEEKRKKEDYSDTILAEYRKIKSELSKIILAADTHQKQSDNGLQRLAENRNKVQFDEDFTNLLTNFLQLINQGNQIKKQKKCILLIDDLDLVEDKVIHELTEHIRKYFNGQMIVILTYKEDQLTDVLLKDKIIKEKDLKGNTDREKLKDQCQKYIEKLIPYEHRIRLKNHKDFYGMNMEKFFDEMITPIINDESNKEEKKKEYFSEFFPKTIVDKEDTVKQWFEKMIFYKSKVNIKAFDKLEQVDEAFANNLRGIIQWIETIYSMGAINQEKINNGNKEEWKKLHRNVEVVRTRVIRTTFDLLKEEQRQFLEMWLNTSVEAKLYQAYYYMGEKTYDLLIEYGYLDNMVDHRLVRSINVSLADMIQMMTCYKIAHPRDMLFIYTFKILYSCELIKKYTQCYILKEKMQDYELLTRRDIVPMSKALFDSETSLNREALNSFLIKLDEKWKEQSESVVITSYAFKSDLYESLRPRYNESLILEENKILRRTRYNSSNPEIRQGIRESRKIRSKRNLYFGNSFFSGENNTNTNSQYLWHPMTLLVNRKYLVDSIKKHSYVLISLFDIDCFLEQNKINKSSTLDSVLEKCNTEFSGVNPQYFKTRLFENDKKHFFFDEDFKKFIIDSASIKEKIVIKKDKTGYLESLSEAIILLGKEFENTPKIKEKINEIEEKMKNRSKLLSLQAKTVQPIMKSIIELFNQSEKYILVLPNEKQPQ